MWRYGLAQGKTGVRQAPEDRDAQQLMGLRKGRHRGFGKAVGVLVELPFYVQQNCLVLSFPAQEFRGAAFPGLWLSHVLGNHPKPANGNHFKTGQRITTFGR
jgi:hypothetical protein